MQRIRFATLGVPSHLPHTHVTRLSGPQETLRHTHDFYETFLVLEGSGVHHLNGKCLELQPGHLAAIRPQDAHSFSATAGPALVFVNVAVSAKWWDALQTVFGWPDWSDSRRHTIVSTAETHRLGLELRRQPSADDPLACVRLWQDVRRALSPTVDAHAPTAPAWLDALRRDLNSMPASLGEPISFWQDRSGRSPEHLSRSCRRHFGMTLRELVNQARVERAMFLLRTSDRKVIAVAYESGFANLAYFHRSFARKTGVTPKRFRESGSAAVPV